MAKAIQLNFTRGELTPLLAARIDLDHYRAGLEYMQNWVPLRYGGMTRMPGTLFYGEAKEPDRFFRYLPFAFNRAQTYAIEAGHLYFRFWTQDGRIEDPPGTPVEVVTPYDEDDLRYIQLRQSGDLVFVVCAGYFPRVLTRTSETVWSLDLYVPLDGPYLDLNWTATTLDPSGTSGSVTITASSTVNINGGTGFQTSDIGRSIRFLEFGGRWYWFVITARASTTSITATFMGRDDGDTSAMPGHAPTTQWRLGAWSAYEGYPAVVGLYEERLVTAATQRQPTTMWGTVAQDALLDDYSFQSPLLLDDGFTAKITGDLSAIQWIAESDDIVLGTEGGVRVVGRIDQSEGFGPGNIRPQRPVAIPTSYVPGFFIENVLLFLDVYRTKLYEAIYSDAVKGYDPRELSALNEHLVGYGITSLAYQTTPHKIIWMTTDTGLLLAATYDRGQEVFGISRCFVGGDGFVEWAMTLPGTTVDGDQLWLAVRRTIDGGTVRYVEVLSAFYRESYTVQEEPIYAHCATVYSGAATNIVSGNEYLEGASVGIWADGVDLGNAVVQSGNVVLPHSIEAEKIVIGLRQSSLARTLRLGDTGSGAPAIGSPSVVSGAIIDLFETGVLRVGAGRLTTDDYDNGLDVVLFEDQSEQDPFEALLLRTQTAPISVDGSWEGNGVCTIETNSMHPATVRAILIDVEGAD